MRHGCPVVSEESAPPGFYRPPVGTATTRIAPQRADPHLLPRFAR